MASASCETAWDCTFDYTDIERIELPEIDCALLTRLLEESQTEDGDMEHPGGFSPPSPAEDLHGGCDDSGLEDMLSNAEDPSVSTCMGVEDSFGWVDMEVVVPSSPSDDDMGEWFMGAGDMGMVDYEEEYRFYSYYCGDMPMEDGYSPLWQ